MNIRRTQRPKTYTNIDNSVINDTRLSAASLGVLIYLLSKPDNWTAIKKEILRRFNSDYNKLSLNGLDNCFKELRKAGYAEIKPVMKKNKEGKMYFSGSEYLIFDIAKIPQESKYVPPADDLRKTEDIPSPEDSPTSEILEPPKSLGVNITSTDLNITNTDINNKKADKQTLSPTLSLIDQFKEVLRYLTKKSGNRFRLGNEAKVKKSDKYKKITARLKEYSIEDLKAVIDVKCKEWGDSAEWCKRLVPKTLFCSSNFERYLDEAENQNIETLKKQQPNTLDISTLKPHQAEMFFKFFKTLYSSKREKELTKDFKHTVYEAGKITDKEIIEIERPAVELDNYLPLISELENRYPELYQKTQTRYNKKYNRA